MACEKKRSARSVTKPSAPAAISSIPDQDPTVDATDRLDLPTNNGYGFHISRLVEQSR